MTVLTGLNPWWRRRWRRGWTEARPCRPRTRFWGSRRR